MPTVRFSHDAIEVTALENAALRDVAQNNGASIPFGCENGICGTCFVRIEEGAANLSPITDQEKETLEVLDARPNERLACQCRVRGDVTVTLSLP